MPSLNTPNEQPPNTEEVSPPSPEATVDWKAAAEKQKRSYDGLQGQFAALKNERDALAGQNRDLTSEYEGRIANLSTERENLLEAAKTFESKFKEADSRLGDLSRKVEIMEKHPDLVPDLVEGALRIDGLEGDALSQYIEKYRGRISASGKQEVGRRIEGSAPPAPHQPNQTPVTFQDAASQLETTREKHGVGSPQYNEAMSLYLRTIQSGQHRS